MPDSLNLIVNITSVNMLSRQHIQHKIPFPPAFRFQSNSLPRKFEPNLSLIAIKKATLTVTFFMAEHIVQSTDCYYFFLGSGKSSYMARNKPVRNSLLSTSSTNNISFAPS